MRHYRSVCVNELLIFKLRLQQSRVLRALYNSRQHIPFYLVRRYLFWKIPPFVRSVLRVAIHVWQLCCQKTTVENLTVYVCRHVYDFGAKRKPRF